MTPRDGNHRGKASLRRLVKAGREVPIEARQLLSGGYPDFVLSSKSTPLGQQVPVFMFHALEPGLFEEQLAFLARNGYCTLTLDEFLAFLRGHHRLDRPSVLLTFDDGHKGWYEVGYPLLRKYGLHAVAFVVPAFVRQEPAPAAWLSWPEIREMEGSGVLAFESHTMRHDRMFVAPRLLDFFSPEYDQSSMGLDVPWLGENGDYTNRLRWGTPIYSYAPRYAGRRRFLDDERLRQTCVEWVSGEGGEKFFGRPDWRRALRRRYRAAVAAVKDFQYESEEEQRAAILGDLGEARQTLGEKLGRTIHHLCYPWGVGSELAISLSREAGYSSNFWVVNGYRNTNRPGDSPFHIPRLKDDYIFRLPGEGRKSLASIFFLKLRRRVQKASIY